ncbi:MAG: hypothetical protein H3C41_10400 [Bacteroidales bacterium]|nr:hypothetical protein [Bacteroidales bacterium]
MKATTQCEHTEKIIGSLLSGESPSAVLARHETHLAHCPVCRTVIEQLPGDLEQWQNAEVPLLPLKSLLPQPVSEPVHYRSIVMRSVVTAAAAIVAGLLLSRFFVPEPIPELQNIAQDYALLVTTDNSFPVEFFNE